MAKDAEDQLRKHIRVDKLTALFRQLDEEFNGYERRVIHAYLSDRVRGSRESLAMGLLETLGIRSQAAYHAENQRR